MSARAGLFEIFSYDLRYSTLDKSFFDKCPDAPAPFVVVMKDNNKRIMTTNTTNTVRLHRVLRAKPERVYRAFLDPDAMVKWLPPNGFTGKIHHLDAKVGGSYKMSFTNFSTGTSHSF